MIVIHCIIIWYHRYPAAQAGKRDPKLDKFLLDAMFATLTNVNFDGSRFVEYLKEAKEWEAKAKAMAPAGTNKHAGLDWNFTTDAAALSEEGKKVCVFSVGMKVPKSYNSAV